MKNSCLLWLIIFISLTAQSTYCNAIISENLLNQAGLQTVWQNTISLNPKEKIQKITILGNHLYILTSSNYLFCIDRNTGRLSFAAAVAAPKLPVFEPADYNGITYLMAGNDIIAADVERGVEIYRNRIPFSAAASAAVNARYLYIPAMDKRLHVMDANGKQENFQVSADNPAPITSVIAADTFAVFATERGNIICMNTSEPKRLWQFDTVGSVTAPLVAARNHLYISSRDTNIYKINAASSKLIWKFPTGSILTTPARVTETVIYQYARDKGLYAIDANSSKQLWLLTDGLDLLAQNDNTAYIFDKNKVCVVMDNMQAKKNYAINFSSVTNYAANIYDGKIYIMEDKNISCIEPIKK